MADRLMGIPGVARFERVALDAPVPARRPAVVVRRPRRVTPSPGAGQGPSGTPRPVLGRRRGGPLAGLLHAASRWPVPTAVLVMALVGGALLRLVGLGDNPPGVNQDEAVTAYDAWSVWLTGRDHHGHPFPFWVVETFTDWSSPLLTFVLAPFVGVFGLDIVVVRTVTAMLGVLMVLGVFGTTQELTRNPWVASLAAVFAAISPWSVHYSRYALLPIIAMATGLLCFWALLWAIRRRNGDLLVAAAILAGLTLLGYHTMKLYVPMIGLVVLVLYGRQLIRFPVRVLLVAGGVGAFLAGPALFLTQRDPDVGRRNEYLLITSDDDFGIRRLVDGYWAYVSPEFLFRRGDGDPTHVMPWYGVELVTIGPLIVLGLVVMAWHLVRPGQLLRDRRATALILAATVLAPLPAALTRFQAANRAAFLSPLLAILCAIAVAAAVLLVWRLARRLREPWRIALVAVLLAAGSVPVARNAWGMYDDYFTRYPHDYAVTWGFHHGLVEAIEFGYPLIDQYDTVWVGDANQTYIFLLFAGEIDPTIAQREFQDSNPDVTQFDIREWRNVRFAPNYESPPDEVPVDELDVLYTSPHRDGEVFYEVRGGTVDGERILVIHSPNR